ncbi:hypothetical protein ILYODFUR_032545, partial [Ilyodon furcidens]
QLEGVVNQLQAAHLDVEASRQPGFSGPSGGVPPFYFHKLMLAKGGTVRDRCKEDWAADEGGDLGDPIPGCLGWL